MIHTFKKSAITIGNDLVNLDLTNVKLKHLDLRFISRILSLEEQQLLNLSKYQNIVLWILWSAKETAYKALQRNQLDLVFKHSKFVVNFDCQILENLLRSRSPIEVPIYLYGTVHYLDQIINVLWEIKLDLIHCIGIYQQNIPNNPKLSQVKYQLFKINSEHYQQESSELKARSVEYLSKIGMGKNLTIVRPPIKIKEQIILAPPVLQINHTYCDWIQISLSHDHGWGAIAYLDLKA